MPDDAALAPIDREIEAAGDLFAGLLAIEQNAVAEPHFNLVRWLLGLPAAADPAEAATLVLGHQRRHPHPALSGPLLGLLRDVSGSPADRLGRFAANRHNHRDLTRRQ